MAIGKTFIQILGPKEPFPNNPGFPTIFLQKQVDTTRTVFGFNDGNGNTFSSMLVLARGTAPGTKLSRIFDVDAASPTDGDTLVYNSTTNKWVSQAAEVPDLTLNSQSGTSYTLVLGDKGKMIEMASATAGTLVIPINASVAFPIGAQILLYQAGAGQITVSGVTGVSILSSGGKTKTTAQYSAASLIKTATNRWLLSGDITT